jgi:signal transduction histidine kinase
VTAGFAAAVFCLVVMVAGTMWIEATRDEQARRVHRTQEALLALHDVSGLFSTAATSLGAILGEGAAWERDLSLRVVQELEPTMERLGALVSDDPAQGERFQRLRPLVPRLAGRARAALLAMGRGERDHARQLLDGVGPAALAAADEVIAEMEQSAQALLAERQQRWRVVSVTGAVVFASAAAVLLLLILQAARLVRTEARERERLSAHRADVVAQQQQIMAIVSHDLRNPLSAMKTGAALLARSPGLDEARREDARRILASARRMERLLADLLDFARLQAGRGLPIQPVQADLVEVCRQAVSDLGRAAEGEVTVEGLGVVTGRWDASRLGQVAANLVSNALKYGPPGRPVHVLVDGRRDEVLLSVTDEGGRLPLDLHQAIFEPFRRGQIDDGHARGSAGLGLFIVRCIAEAHGGAVTVDSTPGRGTTFTVILPRSPAPPAAPAAADG